MMQKKITFDSFIRMVLGAFVVICVLLLINRLSSVLLPFFVAWLIAYILYPFVKFFQYKLHFRSRVLSIIAVILLFLGIITLIIWGVIPPLLEDIGKVKDLISAYFIEGTKHANIPDLVQNFINEYVDMKKVQEALNFENISNIIKEGVPQIWNFLAGSMSVLISIFASFIVLLYMFFILIDYETLSNGWVKYIPKKQRNITYQIFCDVKDGMNRYFRGQALIATCVGILFAIGFLIIDFPLAIGFGLFIGILNMVPYLQLIALVPTVILALLKAAATGQNFWWILFLAIIVFCVVQVIQDMIITPKVMGKAMGMNPAIILLSLSIWGSLMGIVGMILALPLTSLIISYYKRYVIKENGTVDTEEQEETKDITKETGN
ncbi:AI-2E family transporter [Phocaeicola oris]|uniref:AI-2E family transporter n=1 Tax=Phocaeicola oris TaxID=2896850 RepID=UPI00234ED27D|nr:AI-2E family transporter [Phocaeicola oris]MCE2616843.1 AI-2E family transporter [Phocaeicola oris]